MKSQFLDVYLNLQNHISLVPKANLFWILIIDYDKNYQKLLYY